MTSRTLYLLLAASSILAWLTSGEQDAPAAYPAQHSPSPVTVAPRDARPTQAIPDVQPWRRVIDLPATEPLVQAEPEPPSEPLPLPEVEAPPPPPPPSAPPLPLQYLGQLRQANSVTLYVRYQEHATGLKRGDRLGEDYQLLRIAHDHAQFRYLPLDTLQELRWDEQP